VRGAVRKDGHRGGLDRRRAAHLGEAAAQGDKGERAERVNVKAERVRLEGARRAVHAEQRARLGEAERRPRRRLEADAKALARKRGREHVDEAPAVREHDGEEEAGIDEHKAVGQVADARRHRAWSEPARSSRQDQQGSPLLSPSGVNRRPLGEYYF
jgi:hypothetical protein